MRSANGRGGWQHVGREYGARTNAAVRMTVGEGCVWLLLSDVGMVCWFAVATHQYDAPATIAWPAGRAHQVAAQCAGSGTASADMRDMVVCTGGTAAGMHLGLD